MNSRYSLWLVCVCCISLAGCANWQNRARQNAASGSASTLNTSSSPAGLNLFAPGTAASQPPPPTAPAPSDPNMMLPPPGTAATGERLDLSSVSTPPMISAPAPSEAPVRETSRAAVPDKLYNMEKPSSSKRVASADSSSSRKSSTISRLAEKSDSSEKTAESSTAKKESTSTHRPSTLERLARESATASTREVAEEVPTTLPRPGAAAEPVRSTSAGTPAAPAEPAIAEPSPIDTTLLAQPVRKGAGDDAPEPVKNSKGPQSRVIPNSSLFNGTAKPVIYPVSNPAVEEQIDVNQFS